MIRDTNLEIYKINSVREVPHSGGMGSQSFQTCDVMQNSGSVLHQIYKFRSFFLHFVIIFDIFTQVCDSDTMLDPASSVEMVKVLEEDPMVGGVGGDVQVGFKRDVTQLIFITGPSLNTFLANPL